jgi:hypothetical protein
LIYFGVKFRPNILIYVEPFLLIFRDRENIYFFQNKITNKRLQKTKGPLLLTIEKTLDIYKECAHFHVQTHKVLIPATKCALPLWLNELFFLTKYPIQCPTTLGDQSHYQLTKELIVVKSIVQSCMD